MPTRIEWTDETWNPIRARRRGTGKSGWHCEPVSPGCANCYAEGFNRRLGTGLPYKPGHRRDVEIVLDEPTLVQPLRWRRPRMIFPGSMTDLFADFVTDDMLDRIFAVMALCPQHTFQVLTKRPERMRDYLTDPRSTGRIARRILDLWIGGEKHARAAMAGDRWPVRSIGVVDDPDDVTVDLPLPNVWLGVSCEDQKRADARVPVLLDTPAAVRWVSAEPLLGPIDFTQIDHERDRGWEEPLNALEAYSLAQALEDWGEDCEQQADRPRLDWIVVGGESGSGARPMHPDWARSIRDQCAAAGVPFHFKQWGAWWPLRPAEYGDLRSYPKSTIVRPDGGITSGLMAYGPDAWVMDKVGKTAAGRLLDGVTHDAFPEVAHA
ncbi:phage Gp37/Gp68 family protein [Aurantimonas sp. MSK8Z-1]|uniref:phage Gp37/Gp68 family protein n=1 Tax=Mangrovibrevibacter kandeliae TaxID=2968473 RepID=UPI0021183F2E|nr:phage Gp37/Gp68 family protein [Aurantimonas sp. MSK8Z-1]MCW4114783.1 phage Gp37/Gp68 family protein [Aurantimonas sp. MSK8Z-1]